MARKACAFGTLCWVALLFTSVSSDDCFTGSWCIGREAMIITFEGNDSLHVTSLRDESIHGRGSYETRDSTLIVRVVNEDLTMEMGYRYRVKNGNTMRAKILFLIVDGDSVAHPKRWMRMRRCDPNNLTDEDFEGEEETEEE